MVKKLVTIALGLAMAFGATAQLGNNAGHKQPVRSKNVSFQASDVQFWVGTGSNSAVVVIGWDDNPTGDFALAWGVRWNGSTTALALIDSIATHDERLTYSFSGSLMQDILYNDGDLVGSSSYGWCYMLNGSWAPNAYNNQPVANGDLMEVSGSCMFTLTTATAATNPNAVVSCPKAQAVSVTGITTATATVNITDTAYVNDYTVKLYAGDSLVDSSVIYTQTISYTDLTANTGYKVKVFSNCPDGTQTSSRDASFRTPCVTIAHDNLPWVEDFQSYNGLSYSSASVSFASQVFCWDLINPYSDSDPYINSSSSVNPTGGKCLYASSRISSPTIFVLPPFEDTPENLQLSFDVLSTYGHGFEAGVITDINHDSTFIPIALCLPTGSGWNHFDVTFAGITEGRLALRRNDNSYSYIDNITVAELPSCVKPSQVLASDITASSATLTITDPNSSNHYRIYVAEDSVEIYTNTYTLNDLLPNTRYVVRVRTLCSDTTTGVTETAFRTTCGPIAVPYHEDFSQFVDVANGYGYAVADSTLPCWAFLKGRNLDRLELFTPSQSSTYAYGTDGYTLRIYGNNSDSRDILVLPELDQEINTLEISFMARPSETGNFGGSLQVGYITDAADSSTFVAVANYPCARFTNGYDLCAAVFPDAPNGSRIAMRYLPSGGSAKSWYIDDIDVHEMPACVRAQGISVDNIGTESFTLHIADPTTVNHYRYYLSIENFVDSTDIYDTVAIVTGLTASTEYQLRVVSVCEDGSLTMPHTIMVNTLCGPITELPFVENFESWTASQSEGMDRCWNRLYMNSSSRLVTNNYPYCASGTANALNGFKSLKIYSKGASSTAIKEYSVVYLPEIDANMNTLKVSFFYKYGGSTTNINKVKIAVGVSDSVADTNTFTRIATLTPSVVGWNEFEVELGAYTGTGNRITIMQTSTSTTAFTSYIDSLVVDTISSCNRPATLTVSGVSAYGATLTWTDPSEAGSYIVRWSDGTSADSATVTGATSYELTGLNPSTNYTVDVRSICWGAPTNARTETFATSCAPVSMPWSTDFENITNANQLTCWNRYQGLYNDATNSATLSATTSGWTRSTTAFDGSSHVKLNIYGTSCKYWLVTPEIVLVEDAELTFDYMLTSYNDADAPETGTGIDDDRFVVLATTDGGTIWTPVASWGSDTERDNYSYAALTNSISQATVSLAAFTGQVVRLAFYGESTVGGVDNDIRIDNLSVHAASSIPDTTHVDTIVLCNTIHTLPYEENFAGYTTDESMRVYFASAPQPECWTVLGNGRFTANYDTTATASTWFGGIGFAPNTNSYGCVNVNDPYFGFIAYGHYDGTYGTYIANERDFGTKRYAILPMFDHPLSQTVLTFDHRTSARSGAALLVGYIVSDTSDFVAIDSISTDFRVLHHDTVDFTAHAASIPDNARLTLLWKSTDTTHTGDAPANYYCGIDNLKVAVDTTPVVPEPPAPVDATIAASDILYWVGEGQNAVVLAVNWADTALAWGYRFATDSVSTETMMTDIAAADPRLSVLGSGMISDINYIDTAAGMTDTLGITTGNWWNSLLNGASDNGMGQMLVNGDFKKWGDPAAGTVVDSVDYGEYGIFYTYVFPMTIHPVTVPDTTGTIPPTPQPEHGPFCGAVGTEGCNAIKADSSAIVAWATGINVVRGPQSIANPEGPVASTGVDSNALGMATLNNSLQVVSLGDGGSATLTFTHPIRNGEGPDFAVYENSFGDSFLELAFVEVSSDGERFVRFPATSLTQTETQTNSTGATDPTFINNLAGKFRIGYGTPFDLAELADSTGINIDSIVYVRVVDVVGSINPQYGTYDAFGHIINDPWPTDNMSGGFDLSGVAVLNERIDSVPEPPAPVEATIAANEIVYWVGEGSNQVVLAVNWADTALAWGYKFSTDSVSVQQVMDDIMEADSRFSWVAGDWGLGDILFAVAEGDTLRGASYYWESKRNGFMDAGLSQMLGNGDFEKWCDPTAGVVVDSMEYNEIWYYTYVYPMEIHPVSIPVGIAGVEAVSVMVWPNPTTSLVNVSVSRPMQAELYDLAGRRMASYSLAEGSTMIDLSALQSGVYMLRAEGSVSKIVKR